MPGRVLVGFEPGVGEGPRRAAAAAVGGRMAVDGGVAAGGGAAANGGMAAGGGTAAGGGVAAGGGRNRVVELGAGADVRAAARELAGRPGVAFAEPDWIRRVDACDPAVCWHLQPRPGANVLQAHQGGATGAGQTVAVVDTGS